MTILQTTDTVGGVWTYALDLMRALPDHKWILATMGEELRPDQEAEIQKLQRHIDISLCPSTWALEWMPDPWREVDEAGRWLLELEEEYAPDIVHLNGFAHAALEFRAPKLCVAHSCVLSWWRAVKGEDAPSEWDEYRERVREGLHASDVVAAPTRAMLDEVQVLYGPLPQPQSRLQVLPNGRDGLGAPDCQPVASEPFVFAAGRLWDEAKNIGALEAAAPLLDWPVRVAGGDGESSSLQFLGRLEVAELEQTMRRASIYALPARYEPFGLSILEAALSRSALVVGDIPSLREVWGDAALFVPPGNPQVLARAINDLICDAAKREEMAQRAFARAQQFSLKRFGCGYQSAYEMMLPILASPLAS